MTRTEIEKTATSLLLKQRLSGEFALSFFDCRRTFTGGKAIISSISEYMRMSGNKLIVCPEGLTVVYKGKAMVLYDDKIPNRDRINWTIAHELGHVFLSHRSNGAKEELEADIFAAAFLIPSSVLYFLDCQKGSPLTPEEMKNYFPASITACRKRRKELTLTDISPTSDEIKLICRLFSPEKKENDESLILSDLI